MADTVAVKHFTYCVVEPLCYDLAEIDAWTDDGEQVYVCGFILAGTVLGCPKHRRLLAEVVRELDDDSSEEVK